MNLAQIIYKTLTPRIAPMVYIMMMVSVIIGFSFMTGIVDESSSVLHGAGTLVDREAWGTFLFITASSAELGMIFNKPTLIKFGGIAGFMAWLFACIGLLQDGNIYAFITLGLFHLLFHGYVYLATSFGLIYRVPLSSGR